MPQLMTNIGELGEQLVARWLEIQGRKILAHRWRCRLGEIDLIAQYPGGLSFIEVKTRGANSWDAGGILAISAAKQAKLWRAASLYLAQQPHLAQLPCRFDVALVSYRQASSGVQQPPLTEQKLTLGEPVILPGYRLTLYKYIESAFESW